MDRHCKNCDKMLYAADKFCSQCGSKWVDYRLTPRKITEEFSNKYLGSDNRFLVTMIALIRFPEDVINGYIVGQRKKYVNPINLYLISLSLVGLQFFVLRNFYPELLGYNEEVNKTLVKTFFNYLYDYYGLWTTVLMPSYVLTGFLVFLNLKKYNLSEHVIFYVYAFGFSNILFALLTPLIIIFDIEFFILSSLSTLFILIQISYYYKRVFNLNWGRLIVKTLIAVHLFSLINIIYILLLGILTYGLIKLFIPGFDFPSININ